MYHKICIPIRCTRELYTILEIAEIELKWAQKVAWLLKKYFRYSNNFTLLLFYFQVCLVFGNSRLAKLWFSIIHLHSFSQKVNFCCIHNFISHSTLWFDKLVNLFWNVRCENWFAKVWRRKKSSVWKLILGVKFALTWYKMQKTLTAECGRNTIRKRPKQIAILLQPPKTFPNRTKQACTFPRINNSLDNAKPQHSPNTLCKKSQTNV